MTSDYQKQYSVVNTQQYFSILHGDHIILSIPCILPELASNPLKKQLTNRAQAKKNVGNPYYLCLKYRIFFLWILIVSNAWVLV